MNQANGNKNENENKKLLVSPCGIYCGACHKYKKGGCPGCADNEKATWCTIRVCTAERGYTTCAECTEFADVNQCKKVNNFMSKIFSFIFKSDRKASLALINEVGPEEYARIMAEKNESVMKRGK